MFITPNSSLPPFIDYVQYLVWQYVQRDIDETRSIGRGDVGSLHIGFIGSAMLTTLPGIFRSYREAYPRVRLHLHESFTAMVTEGLENGTLDAGLLRDGDPMEGVNVLLTGWVSCVW